jgi:hypothetical protein
MPGINQSKAVPVAVLVALNCQVVAHLEELFTNCGLFFKKVGSRLLSPKSRRFREVFWVQKLHFTLEKSVRLVFRLVVTKGVRVMAMIGSVWRKVLSGKL